MLILPVGVSYSLIVFFQAKLETKALKAKRPGFTDDRYNETSYYIENGKSLYIHIYSYHI